MVDRQTNFKSEGVGLKSPTAITCIYINNAITQWGLTVFIYKMDAIAVSKDSYF